MARPGGKNRGIVEKPAGSGTWWVRLYVNGREQWYRADTKSQATALYGRLKGDIRERRYFPEKYKQPEAITLRVWIQRYLDGSTNRGKRNEARYGAFWRRLLGKRTLDQITTEDLKRIQAKMVARADRSAATINRYFAFVRRVLSIAVKRGKLARNPAVKETEHSEGITFFPEAKKTRWLTDDELTRLKGLLAAKDWALVVFAAETGLRRAEQFGLRWAHADLETGVLTIPLPKGQTTRHVPLTDGALAILRGLDSLVKGSPWVFPSTDDPLQPQSAQSFVNNVYTPALAQAGIQGACWHTLRHTTASRLVRAGVDLVTIQKILGHRDIQTTLRYAHVDSSRFREAINRGSFVGIRVGTGSKTGSNETAPEDVRGAIVAQAVDSRGETAWLGD